MKKTKNHPNKKPATLLYKLKKANRRTILCYVLLGAMLISFFAVPLSMSLESRRNNSAITTTVSIPEGIEEPELEETGE